MLYDSDKKGKASMNNQRIIRLVLFSLSLVVFAALAGFPVLGQGQSTQQSAKPSTNANTQSSAPGSCTAGDANTSTKPQNGASDNMSGMDMSKMDMGNEKAGNMNMSSCPCPNCKSGGCAGGTCSLRDHVAARTNKSGTGTTKRRSSRAQPKKKI